MPMIAETWVDQCYRAHPRKYPIVSLATDAISKGGDSVTYPFSI